MAETYSLDEPKMAEIVMWRIGDPSEDPDISWIPGDLILRINCVDGVVLIYYMENP